MRHKLFITAAIVLLLGLLTSPAIGMTAQSRYRFAYGFTKDNQVVIKTITPDNPTAAEDFLKLPVSAKTNLYRASVSPNGEWISLVYYLWGLSPIQVAVINTKSREVRDLKLTVPYYDRLGSRFMRGPLQDIVWSPDSRYLAILAEQDNGTDIYLYSVQDNTLTNLTADQAVQYRAAWLKDSSRLAVLSEYCPTDITCSLAIEVYTVATRTRQQSIRLFDGVGAPTYDTTVCRIQWSPDGKYISFVVDCTSHFVDATTEVYLLNVERGTISQITNFTTQTTEFDGSPAQVRIGMYETVWYDANTLLIGAVFRDGDQDVVATRTVAYKPSGGMTTIASTMAQEWAVNPATNELAFRNAPYDDHHIYFDLINASVQLATLSSNALKVAVTAPAGCELSWSPDGAFLAYANRGQPVDADCLGSVQGLFFIDSASRQIKQLNVSADLHVTPIGWISIASSKNTLPSTNTLISAASRVETILS